MSRNVSALAVLLGFAGAGLAGQQATNGARVPDRCPTPPVVIQKGDTVWAISVANHVELAIIAELNRQIPDLNLVRPGDQICLTRDVEKAVLAPAVVLERLEPTPAQIAEWATERDTPNHLTDRAILALLWQAGARGDQLIGLAALVEGESHKRTDAVGDEHLADDTWGPSVGPWQIRTVRADTGKGTVRDIRRVSTPEGNAEAAVALWDQSVARGKHGGQPWTAHLLGQDRPHIPYFRGLASELGMVAS